MRGRWGRSEAGHMARKVFKGVKPSLALSSPWLRSPPRPLSPPTREPGAQASQDLP